jgi:tRNA-modifying protein YgfZ
MSQGKTALLPDRGVVQVDGSDAEKLLQQLVTNDVALGTSRRPVFAALLTPQGKVLVDFLVVPHGGSYLLDTAADKTAELVKRLKMYRLRARVDITDASDRFIVQAVWHDVPQQSEPAGDVSHLLDPRLPELGMRMLHGPGVASRLTGELVPEANAAAADYHAHRIALGVPEGGKDYAFGDVFPHEANLDLLHGVSFSKGCFVGQEVVSRMQHRGTARKRIVIVEGDQPLRSGSEVAVGQVVIGTVGSVAGNRGLALLRLDRADEAEAKGQALTAAGVPIAVRRPAYMASNATAGAQ